MVSFPADAVGLCPVGAQVEATDEVGLTGELVVICCSTSAITSHHGHFNSHSEISPIWSLWQFFLSHPTEFPSSASPRPDYSTCVATHTF
jgi:hypothetical protein